MLTGNVQLSKKITTLLEKLSSYSIRLNGLAIPLASAETVLSGYTQSLVAVNDHDEFPISLVGSCVGLTYRGRDLILCTRHQLKGRDPESIALLTDDGQYAITSGGVRHFIDVNEYEFHDLAAFDFTEPCREKPFLKRRFFNLTELPPDTASDRIVCLIASGYPYDDQSFEERRIGYAKRILLCVPDGPDQYHDAGLMKLRAVNGFSFNPDGLSGGGAFVVQFVGSEPRAFFAGVITRAGSGYVHLVKAGFVSKFMDLWAKSSDQTFTGASIGKA